MVKIVKTALTRENIAKVVVGNTEFYFLGLVVPLPVFRILHQLYKALGLGPPGVLLDLLILLLVLVKTLCVNIHF